MTAAADLIAEFTDDPPTLAILKHTNPCGVGQGANLREAWDKAFATDRQAPFGGIIAVNQPLDGACAEAIAEIFSEVIVAPEFTAEALAVLQKKKNLRLLKMLKSPLAGAAVGRAQRRARIHFCCRQRDLKMTTRGGFENRDQTAADGGGAEGDAVRLARGEAREIKRDCLCGADRTLGIGAGQMSRVDSSRIAVWKAGEAKLSLKGSVVCSDAFFPFPDGLIAAAEAGATAAIQPGGSVRDAEVIAAADARGMAMAFTGARHFRH